jgi:uncharacterized protein YggE
VKIKLILVAAIISFVALEAGRVLADDHEVAPTISVTGNAEIKVEPNEAVIAFSIQNRQKTLDESVATNDLSIAKVMKFLETQGIEDKAVRTDVVRVRPIYKTRSAQTKFRLQANAPNVPMVDRDPLANSDDQLTPIGYEARRGISVTVSDLSKLEEIYTGLLKNGVNEVSGVTFRTTDLRKYRDQARLEAIRAAREKAEALAGELGAKLAGVQQITESNFRPGPSPFQNSISFASGAGAIGGRMSRGLIKINASVSVVFLLGNHKF